MLSISISVARARLNLRIHKSTDARKPAPAAPAGIAPVRPLYLLPHSLQLSRVSTGCWGLLAMCLRGLASGNALKHIGWEQMWSHFRNHSRKHILDREALCVCVCVRAHHPHTTRIHAHYTRTTRIHAPTHCNTHASHFTTRAPHATMHCPPCGRTHSTHTPFRTTSLLPRITPYAHMHPCVFARAPTCASR